MKKLLFAMAIGAALAWLFDPDAGSRRRDALKPQARRAGPHRPGRRAAVRPPLGDRLHAARSSPSMPLIDRSPSMSTPTLSRCRTGTRHRRLVDAARATVHDLASTAADLATGRRRGRRHRRRRRRRAARGPARAGRRSGRRRQGPHRSDAASLVQAAGCSSPPGSRRSSSSPGGCGAVRRPARASTTAPATDTYRAPGDRRRPSPAADRRRRAATRSGPAPPSGAGGSVVSGPAARRPMLATDALSVGVVVVVVAAVRFASARSCGAAGGTRASARCRRARRSRSG